MSPRISAWERGLNLFPSDSSSGPGTYGNAARNGKGKEKQKLSIDIVTPSLAHIHACLRLLDIYLLEEWTCYFPSRSSGEEGSDIYRALADGALLDSLVELCVATEILVQECVRDLDNVTMNGKGDNDVKQYVQDEGEGELGTFLLLFLSSSMSSPPF